MIPSLWLALLISETHSSASAFNGTWIMDLDSVDGPRAPHSFALRAGVFSRGDPADFVVKADGVFHRQPSDGYVDSVAISVRNSRHVRELDRFRGRIVYSVDYTVSADRRALNEVVTDFGKPDRGPVPTRIFYHRIDGPRAGAHALDGRWQEITTKTTQARLTERITLHGSRLGVLGFGGSGFDAIVGGPPVPIRGDRASARITVTMPDDHMIVEQMSAEGTTTLTKTMTVLPDGKTIRVAVRRLTDGTNSSWLLHRR
ncbi:hypothetical protein HZF05_04925 [Sphingomonas sp. CGMCC 1.13654]|uniref:Uncharacterized protein n=1 Tax=Sphingomonas chungangi TaxID=2683589 RepID=A0A838L416_9SPHN|nr:hypothetical protein [Sphingomonas chungangi]MBA2933435.1 hypothetical protein [Sphingomonas chungangi]MVW54768.1 hypothetical protein [Sphingomonas chungangi]